MKMKIRQKKSCWQQILTTLGTDSIPEEEWAAIYTGFMESWDNPYYIQSSTDPNDPIRPEYLVRPRSALEETAPTSSATDTKTEVFLEPTSSRPEAPNLNKRRGTISHSLPRNAPSSAKRRETIAHSVSGAPAKEERSPSSSKLLNPRESEYAKIWAQPKKSRESTTKANSKKIRDASPVKRNDTCVSPDSTTSKSSHKSQGSRALKASSIKRSESCASSDDPFLSSVKENTASINPIKKRESFGFPEAATSTSSSVQRRNSCVPIQDTKASAIKRRNTCVPTNAAPNTALNPIKRRDSVANPSKINKQRKNSSLPAKTSEESNDEGDDQLPLSQWLANKKNKEQKPAPIVVSIKKEPPAQACNVAPPPVKRKRGRPSLLEKAMQQARLEAELREAQQPPETASKLNLLKLEKHSAELPTAKPKTQKPLPKAAPKQRKEMQQTPKAPPPKKSTSHQVPKTPQTVVKPSQQGEVTQQPQNLSKSSLKKPPSKPRLQENATNSPPHKKRTISNITAKSPLMPAHMPPTAINLKCPSNRRPSHLYEHNYNRSLNDKKHQKPPPVPASSKVDEDPLANELDDMHLDSSLGGGEVIETGIELMSDSDLLDTPIEMLREVEEIDRCLENFNNKTPSEIDSQLARTTEFFEKLPSLSTGGEVGIYMGEKDELDYEEDDDDVLSVAASWDGLDDEIALEPKPNIAVQEPKPISKPAAKEAPKKIDAVETPKVQGMNPFRIPKISPEELKTQPSVMRLLYKQEEMEKKKNLTTKPAPVAQLADPPLAASARQQREEATAARRVKETLPVFAPPYRLPAEPTVPLVNSPVFIPQLPDDPTPPTQGTLSITDIFGVKCMQSVDNMCRSFNCDHTLYSLGEVQRRLVRMDEETLVNTYRQMLRSFNLFQTFSASFVDVYERRQLWQHLLNMLADCRLYKAISAPLLDLVFGALYKCGMQEEAVRCIMQHLWLPCKASKFRDMTLTVLRILSSANWENYFEKLEELKKIYDFDIPIENLITILQSSVDCRGPKFPKALDLIKLHHETCRKNKTILSLLEKRSFSAMQHPPAANTGPPPHIASHAAGQQCPPFGRHPPVPDFSVPPPPITAHNFNGNNGFQTSNDYSGHFNKPHKQI
ncbi:protein deadlock isoform X2 [Drosophila takahashii]|uniref:protein deadlock isoform X2 n=1 Tax=Drosophila takahashii TaxID=29030 RepID=UPI001CF90807|nr:protein deadlock [Drosophila takahashii]